MKLKKNKKKQDCNANYLEHDESEEPSEKSEEVEIEKKQSSQSKTQLY